MTDFNELSPTFRLYGMPSFLQGMAMAMDASYTMPDFNQNSDPGLADSMAVAADWRAVGNDMSAAMGEFGVR
jgi:hypothetical protein